VTDTQAAKIDAKHDRRLGHRQREPDQGRAEARQVMFKNVLVGVDGTPNGRDAIALAGRLIDPDGKLTLAHVHSGGTAEELAECEELLEQERTSAGVAGELLGVIGASPGRGLHQTAEELGADLLVVGSCRHGAFGRVMLGDNAKGALNGAPCAVAIASRGYAEQLKPFARVGVAYNFSPESRAALEVARRLAAPTRASVYALEVLALTTYAYNGLVPVVMGEDADARLKEANERLKELPGVQGRAVCGLTGEELAAFGDEVDILVVGSRAYGPVRRLVLGSTSDYLERRARCSLLILPRGGSSVDGPGAESGHDVAEPPATAGV
jgi:nucleotide-binding universal stress UspA family protein